MIQAQTTPSGGRRLVCDSPHLSAVIQDGKVLVWEQRDPADRAGVDVAGHVTASAAAPAPAPRPRRDQAGDDTIAVRGLICRRCEHNDGLGRCEKAGSGRSGGGCGGGGSLWVFIGRGSSKCPDGRW